MAPITPIARLPLLLFGMLALIAGVLAGLARMGISQIPYAPQAATLAWGHGALMIPAFLGTVISLERAVALARPWAYLAPLCAGSSGLALMAGLPAEFASGLNIIGGATLTTGSLLIFRQQPAIYTATLALGALSWLIGSLTWWASHLIPAAVPWWMAFLVLTIAGERLELTRYLPTPRDAQRFFALLIGVLLLSLTSAFWNESLGLTLYALTLIILAGWLFRYDIARRTIKQSGLTRFIALCLLSGYGWLATGGVLGVLGGFMAETAGSPLHDAALHSIFLGFVFSMIFGHAPIIFPAVVRVKIPYHPTFYLPLIALHTSLLMRVLADFLEADQSLLRQTAAIGNGLALALFVITMLLSVASGRRKS
ncbi:MAG: hypothetical protein KBD60_08470 [Sterolibacterium sp.]|jgi:hypothetical protein|nr:hypothetical protein [Sterolibacterium sp.]